MNDIKPGFYFIEMSGGDWTVAERIGGEWFVPGTECAVDIDDRYVENRIPTPDEMGGWQVVPKEQTRRMAYAVEDTDLPGFCTSSRQSRHHDLGRQIYEANLKVAPKPGDV